MSHNKTRRNSNGISLIIMNEIQRWQNLMTILSFLTIVCHEGWIENLYRSRFLGRQCSRQQRRRACFPPNSSVGFIFTEEKINGWGRDIWNSEISCARDVTEPITNDEINDWTGSSVFQQDMEVNEKSRLSGSISVMHGWDRQLRSPQTEVVSADNSIQLSVKWISMLFQIWNWKNMY